MENKEVLAKVEQLKNRLEKAHKEKIELGVELKQIRGDKESLEENIQLLFQTLDLDELNKIKEDLIEGFKKID